jgi:DNA-binding transcriptional ArsR family regulator
MEDAEGLARWAGLLADRTRAGFCLALLDGRAWTAGELARHAGVAVSTTSEHLDRLVTGGLLTEHRQGRHRYVSLAGPEVAALIEAMTAASGPRPASPPAGLSAAHRRRNLALARTCYDHLAGALGVALADAMTTGGLIDRTGGLSLTGRGRDRLAQLDLDLDAAGSRRPLLRDCLDWTERRPHLAGVVGAALCRHAITAGWVTRIGTGRAVQITPAGARGLRDQFGLVIDAAGRATPGAVPAAPAGGRHR